MEFPPVEQAVLIRRFVALVVGWTVLTSALVLLLPGDPTDVWWDLMVVAPIVVLPAVFFACYRRSPRLRATMLALDFGAVTAVQCIRAAGIAMLCLWAAGVMTPVFALWAGGIDVLVALSAPAVAYLAASRPAPSRPFLRAWHALGLLDFVVAVPLGLAAAPSALRLLPEGASTYYMVAFPLSFIPMVGVPIAVILHVTALLQLRDGRPLRVNPILHAPAGPAAATRA